MTAVHTSPASKQLASYLAETKPQIDDRLSRILQVKTAEAEQIGTVYGQLLRAISDLLNRGGKRLRPILTLLAYEGFDGNDTSAVMQVAVSQELFHAFILMHDDIIDRDLMRWGGLNIAGSYFERFSQTMSARDALHFAEAWALMAGDICLNLSQETLLASSFKPELLLRASALSQATLFEVIGGETLDVAMGVQDMVTTEKQLLDMYGYKTAAYTFRAPLQIGALLAGANDAALKCLETCAYDLGIAFQLQDDLLGMFGDETVTGKSNLSDLREGKRTFLMQRGLKLATKPQQKIILSCLGSPNVTPEDLKIVRNVLVKSGAREQTEAAARDYLIKAKEQLGSLGFNAKALQLINELTDYLLNRSA